MDLADGHIAALQKIFATEKIGWYLPTLLSFLFK
jgi:hypothetical protein